MRVRDHSRSASVRRYHGSIYLPVLERGAQDLRDTECDVVIRAYNAVLGAEAEISDAELDVLLDHLRGDALHPSELLEQGTVFQFGCADKDNLSILDNYPAHADGVEYVSPVIYHVLTIFTIFI